MTKELVDYNPIHGRWTYAEQDGEDFVITEAYDMAHARKVMDRNKSIEGTGMGKDMRLAASVPALVQHEWLTKHGIEAWNPNHADGVRRLLNSNEYRYLRVNHFML